jgi:hypothetical protein
VVSQLQSNGFPLLPLQASGGPVDLELVNSLREDGVLASLELIATETSAPYPTILPIVRSHRSIGRIQRQDWQALALNWHQLPEELIRAYREC